jgi:hypothetical protein
LDHSLYIEIEQPAHSQRTTGCASGKILRGVGHPEVISGIDPFVIQAEFMATSQQLSEHDRIGSPHILSVHSAE